ncbi:unnamed protein product [Calypogeia fissa]
MDGQISTEGQGGDKFIPGLSDEIVLEHIATKVSWRTLFVLASVNRAWRRAIHEREVYNVRMRTDSGQILVAFSLDCNRQQGFYDLEQRFRVELPPLPRLPYSRPGNIQPAVGAVMLDGKPFVLGDFCFGLESGGNSRRDLHVLDLGACRLRWKPCSSTRIHSSTSLRVACDGKIYTFSMREPFIRGEVFDPEKDEWSRIVDEPLNVCKISAYDGRVASLNKEIYVSKSFGEKLMVFNCTTEKWREVKNTIPNKKSVSWVVMDGKLYNLSSSSVDVYDPVSNTWASIQPIFYENFKQDLAITPYPIAAAPFGKEFLALLEHDIAFPDGSFRKLCKSVGLGLQGCPLVWEILPCPDLQISLNKHDSFLLGSIEL